MTFVDTGLHSNIGQRLLRVRRHLGDDAEFLANYSDGLSNVPLDKVIADFRAKQALASFLSVRSPQSFHMVKANPDGIVTSLGAVHDLEVRINGGFFVLRREIFDCINEGEELVEQPFGRLIEKKKLLAYEWDGFWQCMDTFKDKITYERLEAKGDCPWKVWEGPAP